MAQALLDAEFDASDPIWGQEHKGLPAWEKILQHATPELRKLVANLRANHTKGRQRDSERVRNAERAAEQARADLAAQAQTTAASMSPALAAHLAALVKGAEGADPFTAEGRTKIEEARAAELMAKALEPMRAQLAEQAQRARFDAYVAANPDIREPTVRVAVAKILHERPHLDLEEAHALYRGQRAVASERTLREQADADRAARAAVLGATGAGGVGADAAAPKRFKRAVDALAYFQSQGMK